MSMRKRRSKKVVADNIEADKRNTYKDNTASTCNTYYNKQQQDSILLNMFGCTCEAAPYVPSWQPDISGDVAKSIIHFRRPVSRLAIMMTQPFLENSFSRDWLTTQPRSHQGISPALDGKSLLWPSAGNLGDVEIFRHSIRIFWNARVFRHTQKHSMRRFSGAGLDGTKVSRHVGLGRLVSVECFLVSGTLGLVRK